MCIRDRVDNPLNGVLRLELLCSDPEILHEHGELLGQGSGLELEANDSEMMRPFGAPMEVLHGCRQLVP